MPLTHTDVHDELRQLMRRFLADTCSRTVLRQLLDAGTGHDRKTWEHLAELGMIGLTVSPDHGGEGMGPAEAGTVLEEMGRSLYPGPYLSTVLTAQALAASDDESARRTWLPAVVAGELTATLSLADPQGRWTVDTASTTVTYERDRWLLTGEQLYVIDGTTADLVLLPALHQGRPGLYAVRVPAPGVTLTALDALDATRPLARIDLRSAPAVPVSVNDLPTWFATVRDRAFVALAAEQVGGASRCLEMSVEYACTREQFGRPIGSFQAIKHTCAQLLMEIESARSAVRHAESVIGPAERAGPEASIAAAVARTVSSEAFTRAAKANIQIHGGIGFTWEHDAHLFLRRAKSSELLLGPPREARRRLADLIGALS